MSDKLKYTSYKNASITNRCIQVNNVHQELRVSSISRSEASLVNKPGIATLVIAVFP
jgi:hypothetical protein